MAKKKQFAGKKTKLAELPLTRALEQKAGDGSAWEELQTAAGANPRQLFLSLQRAAEEAFKPLAAAYHQVMEELTILQADLEPHKASSTSAHDPLLPPILPPAQNLKQALRQARESLQDLRRLLSD
jgi:hypothetical protein